MLLASPRIYSEMVFFNVIHNMPEKSSTYLLAVSGIAVIVAVVLMVTQYQTNNLKASISQLNNVALSSASSNTNNVKVLKTSKKKLFNGKVEATFSKDSFGYSVSIDPKQFLSVSEVSKATADDIVSKMQAVSLSLDKPQSLLTLDSKTGAVLDGDIYRLLAAKETGRALRVVLKRTHATSDYNEKLKEFNCERSWSIVYSGVSDPNAPYVYFECRGPITGYSGGETYEEFEIYGDPTSRDFDVWGVTYYKLYTLDWSYVDKDTYYSMDYGKLTIFAE